jgi:NADH-quinone oxidoreductase subunit M
MTAFLDSIGYASWVLHALVLLPLAGIPVILLASERSAKHIAFVVSLLVFIISAGLWWHFDQAAGMQYRSTVAWMPQWGINYSVGLDGVSLVMVLLTTLLGPITVLGSYRYITQRERAFYALLLAMISALVGCFIALDLFVFYVFFELMLIPMYFLIGIWGGTRRLYAAIKFFIYTFLGSLLMLVAIVVLVWKVAAATGTLSFAYDHLLRNASAAGGAAPWLFGAFALAFAIKVPIFPFHTWLPDAHTEAPTAGSVMLASVMLKIGTYGFIRFAVPFFPTVAFSPAISALIVVLAVIGIVYGALVAMVQPDFKRLVAYSSVSHLGFVMLGVWALTLQSVQGALMVMIAHGLSTGALFLLIGMLYERRHSRDIAAFGGIARTVPILSLLLTLVSFSSIGLPGLNGFIGEFLVLLGSYGRYPWATGIATTVVIFAAAYLLWAIGRMIYGKLDKPENEAMHDLSPRELIVLAPLVIGIIWMGLYPGPLLRRTEASARQFIEYAQPGRVSAAKPAVTEVQP